VHSFAQPFPQKTLAWHVGTMLAELEILNSAPWIRVISNGAIPPGAAPIPLSVEGAARRTLLWTPTPAVRRRWASYCFEVVGILAETPSDGTVFWDWQDEEFTITARILRQRHGHAESPLYAQLVTAPGQMRRGTIEGTHFEYGTSPKERRSHQQRAWHAAGLAFGGPPYGRPPKFPTRAAAVKAIRAMYSHVDGWKSSRYTVEDATDRQLATWLRCNPRTLKGLENPPIGITAEDIRKRRI
jgi:hypothetical protein